MKRKAQAVSMIAGLLYFFMAVVCVAVLMPTVIDIFDNSTSSISGSTHGSFIVIILNYWPVWLTVILIIVFLLIIRT